MINFYLARSSDASLILTPGQDQNLADEMFGEVLGHYPQPPFSLHRLDGNDEDEAYESIRVLMSAVDCRPYPPWRPIEIEPFLCPVPP